MNDTVGAQFDLTLALLTTYIKNTAAGHTEGGLKEQGRLADAGLATYKNERTGNDASTQHAIEFIVAGSITRLCLGGYLGKAYRLPLLSI